MPCRSSRTESPRSQTACPRRRRRLRRARSEYLKRFYYDTGLADNAAALAATREIVPADRIVYGTDWPYAVKLEQPLAPPAANAAALVPRLAA